jgi:hypothetical protein
VRKILWIGLLNLGLLLSSGLTANAASSESSKPSVTWNCKLSRILDHRGMVVFFNPGAKMSWYGKEGFYKFYDMTDKTKSLADNLIGSGKVLGEDKKMNSSSIYLGRKFQNFLHATQLNLMVVVSDLKKQTSQASCAWTGTAASGV